MQVVETLVLMPNQYWQSWTGDVECHFSISESYGGETHVNTFINTYIHKIIIEIYKIIYIYTHVHYYLYYVLCTVTSIYTYYMIIVFQPQNNQTYIHVHNIHTCTYITCILSFITSLPCKYCISKHCTP